MWLVIIGIVVALVWMSERCRRRLLDRESLGRISVKDTVLLVTAHPDDECMFFTPIVVALKRAGIPVHLVCCSNGNADGLGVIREGELEKSAAVMGFDSVHLLDSPLLCDGFFRWKEDDIYDRVKDVVEEVNATVLITFDVKGVSGHPNHCSLFHAMRLFDSICTVYVLQSAVFKYVSFLGVIHEWVWWSTSLVNAASVDGGFVVVAVSWMDYWRVGVRAMQCHQSQMVWFRYLYLLFSRHMHVSRMQLLVNR